MIDFGAEHQTWNGQEFHLFEAAINFGLVGFDAEWYFLHDDDKKNTTIYKHGGYFDNNKCKKEA